ncbi:MAG: hypothetical protein MK108_00085 [Mariniblastus sp.]|nr:hypothetical protein [Mariniblastus sp.]
MTGLPSLKAISAPKRVAQRLEKCANCSYPRGNEFNPAADVPIQGVESRERATTIAASKYPLPLRKIGAVSSLNTEPPVCGLESLAGGYEIIYDLPSRDWPTGCDGLETGGLATGELDVALLPVMEAVCNPQYTIISDGTLACRGPVRSVKVIGRVEPERIEPHALDDSSQTSIALIKILLFDG